MADFVQVAIFERHGEYGVLGLYSTNIGTLISSWNPRANPQTKSTLLSDCQHGKSVLNASIAYAVNNGHKLVFLGKPNRWRLS
jgi:hypothetical protein